MTTVADSISVEPMRAADLETVLRIEQQCFPAPWLETAFMTELSNRAAAYFVARSRDDIAGYGGLWVIMGEAHITTLAVGPEYRGHGIGERLLLALIDESDLRNATHMTLEVRQSNLAAQHLYGKYNFREVDILRNYYTDNGENAIVMWAERTDTPLDQQQLAERRRRLSAVLPVVSR